jgi:hypothetical protein
MAVKQVILSFPPSPSADVVGYRLYVQSAPDEVSFNSESFDLGNSTSIDLALLPGMGTRDGVFNVGVTSYDDAGNESAMTIANDIALDFVSPDPPGAITITRT